ncbi:MAG: hypothetical protein DRR08_18240 [Candidatus Parabeggiatoa sp. nov. 2]|nr:MAG: hypothetical protein B6247_14725 [Beggiatoa sp. 4572_84]RKZ57742.1 MAG: hypothetical protein DRR08_18240 [Gammaproteobacteria bacterium]HEC84526.1 hypothetical protein [Thioploca sp.]
MLPLPSEDAAWVRVATPLSAEMLREFCHDLERLYRINPMLEFADWQQLGPNHYYLRANNLSNGQEIATELHLKETDDGFKITYSEGLKSATIIRIEKDTEGTALILIDDYSGLPEAERTNRLAEVDRSLEHWGRDLYRYLHNWQRWFWFPPYRWYMRRVWQPMKPSARRIAYMLIVMTLFELVAFLVIVGLWVF